MLYVEDEENDILLVQHACSALQMPRPLVVAQDANEAIRYLEGNEPPAVVLLDLNLPGKSGLDVLNWIRKQPRLASVPVLVFSCSNQVRDVERARALGATEYLVKPSSYFQLQELLQGLSTRYLTA
jgi:CheY-like chemotaxis protein